MLVSPRFLIPTCALGLISAGCAYPSVGFEAPPGDPVAPAPIGAPPDEEEVEAYTTVGPHPHSVGIATEDVTPNLGSVVGGSNPAAPLTPVLYLYPSGFPIRAIERPLLVSALAVGDDVGVINHHAGHRVVLVTLDVCNLDTQFTSSVRTRVAASRGLAPEEVILNASHTHSAPAARPLPTSTVVTAREPNRIWLRFVEDRTVLAVERAVDDMRPAVIHFGRGETSIGRNRRGAGFAHSVGYDATLDVLRVDDRATHAIRAVAFFHGCHPTRRKEAMRLSPDYPGLARDLVQAQLKTPGHAVTAFFFQGFAGDIGPLLQMEEQGERLANDVVETARAPMAELKGPIAVRDDRTWLPLQKPFPRGPLAPWNALMERYRKTATTPTALGTEIEMVRIGNGSTAWRLIATAHEPVTEWATTIRATWGQPERTTVMGYSNAVESYLPTQAMIDGDRRSFSRYLWTCCAYEGFTSFFVYGLPAPFRRGPDDPPSAPGMDEHFLLGFAALRARPEWKAIDATAGKAVLGRLALVARGDNQLDLFARGTNEVLLHKARPYGAWGEWYDPAAAAGLPRIAKDPAAVGNDGRLDVFYVASGGAMWQLTTTCGKGCWKGTPLGGDFASAPAAVEPRPGRIDVFAIQKDGRLAHRSFSEPLRDGGWSAWDTSFAAATFATGARPVAIASSSDTVELFARSDKGALLWARSAGGGWTPWFDLGGDLVGDPAAVAASSNRMLVAARTSRGVCTVTLFPTTIRAMGSPVGTAAWSCLKLETVGDPALASRAPGRVTLAVREKNDAVCSREWSGLAWGGWRCGGDAVSDPSLVVTSHGAEVFAVSATGALATYHLHRGGLPR